MIQYRYCPYHPWRHGWRREKIKKLFCVTVKLGLIGGILLLSGKYVKQHTTEYTYERESGGEDALGVGIDKNGDIFFFRRKFLSGEIEKPEDH